VVNAGETTAPAAVEGVESGRKISIQYTLRLEDGTEVENNIGGKPLTFVHGAGEIIAGLDAAMIGMKAGESKTVTIEPRQAYGPVDLEAFRKVSLLALPEDERRAGALVVAHDPQQGKKVYLVDRVEEDMAVLDGNHPMAGKTLIFDFKILAVE
jgi:FKBP-type peptidyl-prolyl cis-trans isomerase 2